MKNEYIRTNNIYLSDRAINSVPNDNIFINSLIPMQYSDYFNFNLNELMDLPDYKTNEEFRNFFTNFLSVTNYKYDNEYHYISRTAGEIRRGIKDDNKVIYKLNKHLFRCDNFTNEHVGSHILFAGCSETFGEGGNIEDNWSHKVYQKLSETNTLSGYFNVSVSGANWYQILINLKKYIKTFGAPDFIFMLAPNLNRYFEYDKNLKYFVPKFKNQPITKDDEYFDFYKTMFIPWLMLLKFFIDYCEFLNIKIIWSTWSTQENSNIIRTRYFENSFLSTWDPIINEHEDPTICDILDLMPTRRDGHHGNFFHNYIANSFLIEISKRKYFLPPESLFKIPVDLQKMVVNENI